MRVRVRCACGRDAVLSAPELPAELPCPHCGRTIRVRVVTMGVASPVLEAEVAGGVGGRAPGGEPPLRAEFVPEAGD